MFIIFIHIDKKREYYLSSYGLMIPYKILNKYTLLLNE